MNTIFKRTSVRDYQEKAVEQEKVEKLLQAAMAAPSAGNQQPWEFYVVTQREILEKLAECSPYADCVKKAPLAIITCYRKENIHFPEYAQIDVSACTQNILLEAVELELGAVWLGIAPMADRMENVKQLLQLPENLEAFAIVSCGYPKAVREQQDRFDKERIHVII